MHSPSWFYTLLLLLPSLDSPSLFPSTFCNAVDTHDHSKKLDDDEMEEEPREGSVIFPPSARALVKYFPRRLTRFAWLRYYDCRKFRGDRGRKRKRRWKRKRDGSRAKERRSGEERREEKEREEREKERFARRGLGEQSKRTGRLFMATILQIYELVPVESSGRHVFPVQNV